MVVFDFKVDVNKWEIEFISEMFEKFELFNLVIVFRVVIVIVVICVVNGIVEVSVMFRLFISLCDFFGRKLLMIVVNLVFFK